MTKMEKNIEKIVIHQLQLIFRYFKEIKKHPRRSRSQTFSKNNSDKSFLILCKNKLQKDLEPCLNFGMSIGLSLNKRKLKDNESQAMWGAKNSEEQTK